MRSTGFARISTDDTTRSSIVGGSGALIDLANSFRVHDLLLAFYQLNKPVAAECYGVGCLAFARDENERRSITPASTSPAIASSYEYKKGTGFARTDLVMAGPPYPLEYILRAATVLGGQYHSNFGRETSVIVDYPFVTGRTTADSYLTGSKLVEVLESGLRQWGFHA